MSARTGSKKKATAPAPTTSTSTSTSTSTPASTSTSRGPLRIAFLHPDLGIGGAERLVVDAALALQHHGHSITMYTAHHDPSHCFIETRDGTLKVHVYGDWLPQSILKKAHIICAIMRNLYVAMVILLTSLFSPYDILFIDQLSISIPLLRLTSSRILFYCHHPDMLLTQRGNLLKRLYRIPVDLAEELTTGLSDRIVVNSLYTQSVFTSTFKHLRTRHPHPTVVYPSINLERYKDTGEWKTDKGCEAIRDLDPSIPLFVSVNRFERKKNIGLAIEALALLPSHTPAPLLIIAGGYDDLNRENIEHYPELQSLATSHHLSHSDYPDMSGRVIFLRSFSDAQRTALLARANAVIYTPANEHFGIVPIEAMYAGRPVIAVNNGGPLESIIHEHTGYLCEATPQAFASAMYAIVKSPHDAQRMGQLGHTHVESRFSLTSFGNQINSIIDEMLVIHPYRYNLIRPVMIAMCAFVVILVYNILA